MVTDVTDVLAFATVEAIKAGDCDRHLRTILAATKERLELIDPSKPPRRKPPESHQLWVWMNGPGTPHWEIRGTGASW
jgi:hypothetical protein